MELNMDETVTLLVKNNKAPNAALCETWLSGKDLTPPLEIEEKRRGELE